MKKFVYFFGNKQTEGNASEKYILGGKGANLAEMSKIGIPVPPGFTISTEVCKYFYDNNKKYLLRLNDCYFTNKGWLIAGIVFLIEYPEE